MPADQHAALRAVSGLVQGVQKDIDAHRKETATDALVEREVQYQLPVSGTATASPEDAVWGTVSFNFEHSFPSMSTGMRDSDLETPQATFGWQLKTEQLKLQSSTGTFLDGTHSFNTCLNNGPIFFFTCQRSITVQKQ